MAKLVGIIAAAVFLAQGAVACMIPPSWTISDDIHRADAIVVGEVEGIELQREWARRLLPFQPFDRRPERGDDLVLRDPIDDYAVTNGSITSRGPAWYAASGFGYVMRDRRVMILHPIVGVGSSVTECIV